MRRKIQSILLPNDEKFEWKWNLFYKGDRSYLDRKNKTLNIGLFQRVDFVTYLNGCSIKKWEQYTCVEDISLQLDMEGDFIIVLTGCHMDTDIPYQKEISQHEFHLKERQTIEIPYPENDETIIGFEIVSLDKTIFYGGAYIAECEEGKQREVVLSIATTTCKKEEFIKKNIALLQSELFENGEEEIKEHIFVHVVDNGRTLDPAELESDNVKVHPNLNTGGSGGFARGMIESMHQTPAVTNVLLMDDDVIILPESIRKTYILLTLLKPEYYEHFISGAMLLYEEMNVQHEDIGHVYGKGDLKAIKPRLYHEHLWDILKNEEEYTGMKNTYAGWWYCCIPVTQIKKNGLPLPVFIRADDIEYSLRSKAQIITMNGICIWHMGFTNKINASFDLYQKIRNYMIAQSTTSVLTNMDIYGMWTDAFWREVYRFNYNAAELLLRALEDYMKGPAFIEQNLGEAIVIENNKKNEKMLPIAECCDYEINLNEVFNDWKRKFIEKCLYHLTANGHRFWPEKLLKRKPGIIPFAYVVVIQKQTLRKTLISVNPYTKTAAIRTINKKRYHELVKRYRKDVRMYKAQKEKIANEYKTRREYITSEEFWRKYLEI
ncbi:MAG: glycosyltransferase [Lachnospiraceae bacterium]|nr:glycosyltransferase [Lachnospiraceae bacterium]